jgi:hypothetical protein
MRINGYCIPLHQHRPALAPHHQHFKNILFLKLNYGHHAQKDSLSSTDNNSTKDDFWASDESFEALINDEEDSDEEMESHFHDDSKVHGSFLMELST